MDVLHDLIFGAGTAVKQCQTVTYTSNTETYTGRNSGGASPAEIVVMSAQPTTSVTTTDIAGFSAIFGTLGANVTSGTVTVPMRKRANGSTYAGTSSHFTMTGANAYGFPTSYSATQGSAATATAQINYHSTTGLAAPLAAAVDATLAAQSYNVSYTLGPAGVDGTQVPEITAITINPGLTVEVRLYNGSSYPEKSVIISIDPTMELTFADMDSVEEYGPIFTSNVGNDVTAFFRKMADGSTRVADATEEHMLFTLSGGVVVVDEFSGNDTSDASGTIMVKGESLTVSATSAISFS